MGTVEVRRSARRRRTVSAYRDGDRTIVLLPARLSRAAEAEWVATMLARLEAREARAARRTANDDVLARRARALSDRYLDGRARPASVRWVTNQATRWGSCTPADRTIRLSDRLRGMPDWVVDYVLVHELAHLLEAGHTERFWALVARYPMAERARGYLLGVAAAHPGLPREPDADESDVDESDVDESDVDESDVDEPGAHQPGAHELDVDEPDVDVLEADEPEAEVAGAAGAGGGAAGARSGAAGLDGAPAPHTGPTQLQFG